MAIDALHSWRWLALAAGALLIPLTGESTAAQRTPIQAELDRAQAGSTDWLHANHDYGGQRFVGLGEIHTGNASALRPVCLYQSGDPKPFRPYPIVHRGTIYLTTSHSTIALDGKDCRVRWRHDREPEAEIVWITGGGGIALKDGVVIRGTLDGHLLALDSETGELLWKRRAAESERGESFTMPPLIYEDLILIGPAGSEVAVQGWLGAFRLEDGEPVWRFHTFPAADEPALTSWGSTGAKVGGGAIWTPLSLDPERGRVYVPVSNPAPDLFGDARPGENLYTSSLVVLDVRTGRLDWYHQVVPHDTHDWDLTQVSPLFRTRVSGRMRDLVTVVGKDGVLHMLDRDTREHLYELPITTRRNVDAPITVEGVHVCPGLFGGVEWNGPAYSPQTNMLYVPAVDWCGTFKRAEALSPEDLFQFGGDYTSDPVDQGRGWLTAVDASTGEVRWRYESRAPMVAGVTTTSANVIFTGELTGDFIALDARSGDVLYRFHLGGPINGGVVTYAVDGKQYVAVASGNSIPLWELPPTSGMVAVFALH